MAADSFEAYCDLCKTTRTFRLVKTEALSNTYRCNYCSLEKGKLTGRGIVKNSLGVLGFLAGIIIGGGGDPSGGGF